MIRMLFSAFILILTACSNSSSGGGSGAAAITGYDYSGTYISNKIECYNSALTTLKTSASLTSGQETIIISGNSFTSTLSSGSCSVAVTGTIQFLSTGMNIPTRTVTSATGGGCSVSFTVTSSPANTVSPTTLTTSFTTNQNLGSVTNAGYIRNTTTNATAILSNFINSAASTDLCLLVYTKQ